MIMSFITYHWRDLHQCHVIAVEGHNKQHGLNALKAAEPLPPLTPLAPDIVQPDGKQNKIQSGSMIRLQQITERKKYL